MMRGMGLLQERRAQVTLEMAIVTPLLIVLALIVYNLMAFSAAVARFDRVAPDIVIAHGIAPDDTQNPDAVFSHRDNKPRLCSGRYLAVYRNIGKNKGKRGFFYNLA